MSRFSGVKIAKLLSLPETRQELAGNQFYLIETDGEKAQLYYADTKKNLLLLNTDPELSIGDPIEFGTLGSVLFLNSGGVLDQDPDHFYYNKETKSLRLDDPYYFNPFAGYDGKAYLSIANLDPIIYNDSPVYGILIDVNRGVDQASVHQTSGIRVRANIAKTVGSISQITTAAECFVENAGDTTGNAFLQAVEGNALPSRSADLIVAGDFGAGTQGTHAYTVNTSVALRAFTHSTPSWTITNSSILKARSAHLGSVTNLYGLNLSEWSGSSITNSYGIYADTSIDRGTSAKYFIYSLSTSPSLFTGDVSVPDEIYGSGWNGSTEVPTKNALYDKIETLSGGGYTDEDAQDAVASILFDSDSISWSYDDLDEILVADVIDHSITFAKMQTVNTNVLLGNDGTGTAVQEIDLGLALTFASGDLSVDPSSLNLADMTGVLGVAHGGTGRSSAAIPIVNVTGSQTPTAEDSGTCYNFTASGSLNMPTTDLVAGETHFFLRIGYAGGISLNGTTLYHCTGGGTSVITPNIFGVNHGAFTEIRYLASGIWQLIGPSGQWSDDS